MLHKYNAYDAINTWRLYNKQQKQLEEQGLEELQSFLCRTSTTLQQIETNGFTIDMESEEFIMCDLDLLVEELKDKLASHILDKPLQSYVLETNH